MKKETMLELVEAAKNLCDDFGDNLQTWDAHRFILVEALRTVIAKMKFKRFSPDTLIALCRASRSGICPVCGKTGRKVEACYSGASVEWFVHSIDLTSKNHHICEVTQ